MTDNQALQQLRQDLALDERMANLLKQVGKAMAENELRAMYATNDAATLIRCVGLAQGMEKLVAEITKSPARPSTRVAEGDQ